VNLGETIDLYVSTPDPTYTIEIFRLGFYQGLGGRRVRGPVRRPGVVQPAPSHDPTTHLVECAWSAPYRIVVKPNAKVPWTSGVYVAKLTAETSHAESYITFIVRHDGEPAYYLYQSSAATYQAYNNWGGHSLYASNSAGRQPARKVSFNRPYVRGHGAGDFFQWEYDMVRFMEHQGYDVTYATSVDLDANPKLLDGRRAFMTVGHDEYWTFGQRAELERALSPPESGSASSAPTWCTGRCGSTEPDRPHPSAHAGRLQG